VVDLGDEREVGDDEKLASDALVFILVAVNSFWKVPLGYFFINGTDPERIPFLHFIHISYFLQMIFIIL